MINEDFKELFMLLNEHEVRYLVIGGYAVAFHGYPRYTKDIDIWIDQNVQNVERLFACLNAFGFGSLGLKMDDFTEGDNVVQLGYPPRRVDFITGIKGMEFGTAYERRRVLLVNDVKLNYVDVTDLIESKRISGRLQDLADIEKLENDGV